MDKRFGVSKPLGDGEGTSVDEIRKSVPVPVNLSGGGIPGFESVDSDVASTLHLSDEKDPTNSGTVEDLPSSSLEVGDFSVVGKRSGEQFVLNPDIIDHDELGDSFIQLEGTRYYGDSKHSYCYRQIVDHEGKPCFYFGNSALNGKPNEEVIVLGQDGRIFRGERDCKKPINGPIKGSLESGGYIYKGRFENGKPITSDTIVRFQRKGEYYYPEDGKSEIYIAYPSFTIPFVPFKDGKPDEDWSSKRGSVVSVEIKTGKGEKKYELYSWGRKVEYEDDGNSYIFKNLSGEVIKIPKIEGSHSDHLGGKDPNSGENRAKYFAHLVNAIGYFISKHSHAKFFKLWGPDLKVKYSGNYLIHVMLKDVPGKIGISARKFSHRLNGYYS